VSYDQREQFRLFYRSLTGETFAPSYVYDIIVHYTAFQMRKRARYEHAITMRPNLADLARIIAEYI
jgi:hypothetical protein